MKVKQLLALLIAVPFIFLSCEKDKDYRDKYEGIYVTNVVGAVILADFGFSIPVMASNEDVVVEKFGSKQLRITVDVESTIVTVDEAGNFTIPAKTDTVTEVDPETGIWIMMNMTSSSTGTITNKTLYMTETVTGSAVMGVDGETYNSVISGTVVYNGTKK